MNQSKSTVLCHFMPYVPREVRMTSRSISAKTVSTQRLQVSGLEFIVGHNLMAAKWLGFSTASIGRWN